MTNLSSTGIWRQAESIFKNKVGLYIEDLN